MKILCKNFDHRERSDAHRERSEHSKTKIIANQFKFQLEIQKASQQQDAATKTDPQRSQDDLSNAGSCSRQKRQRRSRESKTTDRTENRLIMTDI